MIDGLNIQGSSDGYGGGWGQACQKTGNQGLCGSHFQALCTVTVQWTALKGWAHKESIPSSLSYN